MNHLQAIKQHDQFNPLLLRSRTLCSWLDDLDTHGQGAKPGCVVNQSTLSDCPEGVAVGSLCLTERDSFGAYYWLAVPHNWKGTLVVHSHGGPELGEPKADLTFVEMESSFKSTLAAGGSSDRLVQTFTQDQDHSYTSDAQYVSAMRALIDWVQQGKKPTPASIAAS